MILRHNFRHAKTFSKKHHKREAIDIQHFPLVLYVHLTTKISNLRHKTPSAPRFLQHYYRATQKQINSLRKFEGYTQ